MRSPHYCLRESEMVLSFLPPDDELGEDDLSAVTYSAGLAETLGEPWKTRLRPSEAFAALTCHSFGEVFRLTPKRAQQRYFASRSDTLGAPGSKQVMAATV